MSNGFLRLMIIPSPLVLVCGKFECGRCDAKGHYCADEFVRGVEKCLRVNLGKTDLECRRSKYLG